MRVLVVVLSMTIGAAGCARKVPETPQPTPATADASPPAATVPAKPSTAPPSTVTNNPEEEGAKPPQVTTAKPDAPASPEKPATPSTPAKPSASTPTAEPSAPATPAKPAPSTATAKPAPTKPATPAPTTKPATPPAQTAAKPTAPEPRATSSNPTLDLTALKEQLKSTKAIGLMTKLTLKNQVDDLLDGFRDLYAGKGKNTMPQLRQSYDMLMMKVLSLLQDKDQKLASDIVASREVIWNLLADPKKFAALDV
jgi:hypothetical protein